MKDAEAQLGSSVGRTYGHKLKCLAIYTSIWTLALLGVVVVYRLFGGTIPFWSYFWKLAITSILPAFVLGVRGGYIGLSEHFVKDLDRALFVQVRERYRKH